MTSSKVFAALVIASGVAACAAEPSSDAESAERTFVETLGVDTIAVESFARTDSSFEGQVVSRNPVTTLARYRADLDDAGQIVRFAASWHTADALDGPPSSRVTVVSDAAGVRVIRTRPEGTDTVIVEPEATLIPSIGRLPLAVGMVDYATRRAVAEGAAAMDIAVLAPMPGRLAPNAIEARGEGVYSLDYFGSPQLVSVDEVGAVQSISGRETTNRVEIVLAGELDLDALAADFAARDASGNGLGTPSPTDTTHATIGGSELTVVYGRPAMRGREIWGGLVPHDEVWRTGANAATHFTTSRPIRLGNLDVPAGAYTLWSTFSPEGATLIVNSQTGQWGTAYDAEQDFGRTALEQRAGEGPVERFTIEIGETDGAPELRLAWADRVYVTPIAVR
ncbi:MAG: DUF2911 domain-containing protein [Gemmatimonadota bacterium]